MNKLKWFWCVIIVTGFVVDQSCVKKTNKQTKLYQSGANRCEKYQGNTLLTSILSTGLESLDSDGGLSSPSEKTSAAMLKEFDRLLPNYLSRAFDVVILTSIYRPTKRILLSFVSCVAIQHHADIALWRQNKSTISATTFSSTFLGPGRGGGGYLI